MWMNEGDAKQTYCPRMPGNTCLASKCQFWIKHDTMGGRCVDVVTSAAAVQTKLVMEEIRDVLKKTLPERLTQLLRSIR